MRLERNTHPSRDAMFSLVALKVLVRILIILAELPNDILADVAVRLFDFTCHPQLVFWWHSRHLSTFSHEIEHKLGNIATGDGDVLDGAANNIPLRTGNDVGDTIARVDDRPSERAVGDTVGCPGGGKGKDSLDGDVEALDVERFKEDLGGLLSVLWRVQRRLGLADKLD